MRCNVSKRIFENLYKIVLTKKRKLVKKGRNHPFAEFDKFSKKNRKSKLLIGIKIGLEAIIIIKHIMVAIIEAKRGLPSLKMLMSRPSDAQRGMYIVVLKKITKRKSGDGWKRSAINVKFLLVHQLTPQ